MIDQLQAFAWFDSHLHGPAHWARVQRFGALLSGYLNLSSSQARCVEVFAWTHDLARVDDSGGNQHAIDGAAYVPEVISGLFPGLGETDQALVSTAIRYHSDGMSAEEAYYRGLLDVDGWSEDQVIDTVGACWDADRLDLLRLGIEPARGLMSTGVWEDVLPLARRLHCGRGQRSDGTIR